MAEGTKKTDLWQLLAIVVIVVAVLLGLYFMNEVINTRFNSLEQAINGNADVIKVSIDNLGNKMQALSKVANTAPAAPAANAAATADQGQAGGEAAAPKEGAAAPKAE